MPFLGELIVSLCILDSIIYRYRGSSILALFFSPVEGKESCHFHQFAVFKTGKTPGLPWSHAFTRVFVNVAHKQISLRVEWLLRCFPKIRKYKAMLAAMDLKPPTLVTLLFWYRIMIGRSRFLLLAWSLTVIWFLCCGMLISKMLSGGMLLSTTSKHTLLCN